MSDPVRPADPVRHNWYWTGTYLRGLLLVRCDICGDITMRVGTNWPAHIDGQVSE